MNEEREEISAQNNIDTSNPSFIDLRLNTKGLIDDLENFLSAKRLTLEQDHSGVWVQRYEKNGKPLANSEGVTAILNMVLLRTHHHAIQGNMDREHYWSNISKCRKEIAAHIVMNCYLWGIDDGKLNFIIDTIMDYIEKVGSRLIDNEERKSYMSQIVTREQLVSGKRAKENALANFAGGLNSGG